MFQENLVFYGKNADYLDSINEMKIFERLIDIILLSACLGILFDKKGENVSSKNKREIFASTINNESENFKMLAIAAYLKNENVPNISHDKLMSDLFIDLENNSKYDENRNCLKKYNYLKEYMYGGLEFLFKIVNDNAIDNIDKIKNFSKLFEQIGQINSKGSLKIIESLMVQNES